MFLVAHASYMMLSAHHKRSEAETNALEAKFKDLPDKIERHTFGFYVNEFNAEDASRLRDTYGGNFDRLVALKTKYDPNNLFRLNANVTPRKRESG